MAMATATTGTEAVGTDTLGMVAPTTVADTGMETLIGGVTRLVSGTMSTITSRIRPITWTTRRLRSVTKTQKSSA
jgi:hypothetical protein